MKRSFPILAKILLPICLLCAGIALAACGGSKTPETPPPTPPTTTTATLTLDAGEGGTLSQTEYSVEVGQNVSQFLQDKTPQTKDGFEFAGWYNGGKALSQSFTMPGEDCTLAAKYLVSYTARLYFEALDGSYGDYETRTGKAMYGEAFTYTVQEPHFTVDAAKENKLSVAKLGAGEVFEAYLARGQITVTLWNNLPESDAETVSVRYGEGFMLPAAPEGAGEDFRFAGWSSSANGEVMYAAGENVTPDPEGEFLELFARWEVAVHDFFDGDDRIFVSATQQGVVYLQRYGLGEKEGSYDPDTGIFVFSEGEEEILTGKLFEQGFYYFKDTMEREYLPYGGGVDRLSLMSGGEAEYRDAAGNRFNGSYDVEPETGDFFFDGGTLRFAFRIVEGAGSDLVFRIQGEEAGSYRAKNSSDRLTLDGFGGFEGLMNGDRCSGLYMYDNSDQTLLYLMVRDNYNIVTSAFYIRYGGDGYFAMDDGLGGTYPTADGGELMLDGFGQGTFNGAEIEYETYFEMWYAVSGFDMSLYSITEVSFGDTRGVLKSVDGVTTFAEVTEKLYGVYDIDNAVEIDGILYTQAFVYCYGDGTCDVWVPYGATTEGYGVFILLIPNANVALDAAGEKVSVTDEDYDLTFDLLGRRLYAPQSVTVVDEFLHLTIDSNGDAYINGTTPVDYYSEPGYYYVYHFLVNGAWCHYIYAGETFVAATLYTESLAHPNRQGDWLLSVLQFDDRYAVGVYTNSEVFAYVLVGDCTPLGGGEYQFEMTQNNATQSVLDLFGRLRFRITGDMFERYDGAVQAAGLTLDGYGHGEYNGERGVYYPERDIIVFCGEDAEYRLRVTEDGVTQLGGEAGVYSLFLDGELYPDEVLYLDGEGNATLTMLEYYAAAGVYTDQYVTAQGSYTAVTEYPIENFTEYCLEFPADTAFYGIVGGKLYVAAERVEFTDGYSYGGFILREPSAAFHHAVQGGGELYSDGWEEPYGTAYYTDADGTRHDGALALCDLNDRVYEDRGYTLDPLGKTIIFTEYRDGEAVNEFIFDIKDDGSVTLRKELSGAYVRVSETERTGEVMYLDGYGNATLYDAQGAETARGSVQSIDGDTYAFWGEHTEDNFVFRLYAVLQVGGRYLYEYREQLADETVFISHSDWRVLVLDGYGLARYIDRYGVSLEGEYTVADDVLAVFYPNEIDAQPIYFNLEEDSFSVNTDEFVRVEDALYGYQGTRTSVTVPGDISIIKKRAFFKSDVTEINLGSVTAVEAEAFYRSDLQSVTGNLLQTVGARAFYDCEYLVRADIPVATTLGDSAFYGCQRLRSITLREVESIGAYCFTHEEMTNDTLSIDLTACPDPNAVRVDADAFVGMADGVLGGSIHVRLLLKDIATVNAVYNGEAWGAASKYAQLSIADRAFVRYVDLAGGKVYATLEGRLAVSVATKADYDEVWGDGIAIYDGEKLYFLQASGGYNEAGVEFADALSANGYLLFAENVSHALTTEDGKQFVFTLQLQYGMSTGNHHYEYTVTDCSFDGAAAQFVYIEADTLFFGQAGEDYVSVSATSLTACTVRNDGCVVRTADGLTELAVRFDEEGKLSAVISFRYKKSATGNWLSRLLVDWYEEDGQTFVRTGSAERPEYWKVSFDEQHTSVQVEHYGKQEKYNPRDGMQTVYETEAVIVVEGGKIVKLVSFVYNEQEVAFTRVKYDGATAMVYAEGATYRITYVDAISDYITVEIV